MHFRFSYIFLFSLLSTGFALPAQAICLTDVTSALSRLFGSTDTAAVRLSDEIANAKIEAVGWENFLRKHQWHQTPVSLSVGPRWQNLPAPALKKLQDVRKRTAKHRFTPVNFKTFNRKNILTNSKEPLFKLISGNMRGPHARVVEMFSDTGAWINYFEDTIGAIYTRMLNSGDELLMAEANSGKISERIMMDYFRERFAARGLQISEIPVGAGVVSFDDFRGYIKAGPIWDRALEASRLPRHGAFPHLFQLDYAIDDMVKASDGAITQPQQFFDFWGTEEGLAIWNDVFDLFEEKALPIRIKGLQPYSHTLRDTIVVTVDNIQRIPRVP